MYIPYTYSGCGRSSTLLALTDGLGVHAGIIVEDTVLVGVLLLRDVKVGEVLLTGAERVRVHVHQHLATLGAAVELDVPELGALINLTIPLAVGVVHKQLAGVEAVISINVGIGGRAAAVGVVHFHQPGLLLLVSVHIVTTLARNHRQTILVHVFVIEITLVALVGHFGLLAIARAVSGVGVLVNK